MALTQNQDFLAKHSTRVVITAYLGLEKDLRIVAHDSLLCVIGNYFLQHGGVGASVGTVGMAEAAVAGHGLDAGELLAAIFAGVAALFATLVGLVRTFIGSHGMAVATVGGHRLDR